MNKKFALIIGLSLIYSGVSKGDIYKCKLASGITQYQETPCYNTAKSLGKLAITPRDPKAEAQAKADFTAWRAEQARLAALKELELERQMTLEALRHNALAQARQPPMVINNILPPVVGFGRPFMRPHYPHRGFSSGATSINPGPFSPLMRGYQSFAPFANHHPNIRPYRKPDIMLSS